MKEFEMENEQSKQFQNEVDNVVRTRNTNKEN